MEKTPVTAYSYSLEYDSGGWLAQILISSDGMFSAVSDWGNASFAWRNYGERTFKDFLLSLQVDYFATKMASGMSYIMSSKRVDAACKRFAEKVLPALQKALREEAEKEKS